MLSRCLAKIYRRKQLAKLVHSSSAGATTAVAGNRTDEAWVEVDQTATVSHTSRIGTFSRVGSFAVVDDDVYLDRGVDVGSNSTIHRAAHVMRDVAIGDNTVVGPSTQIYPRASLGSCPQDKKYNNGPTTLTIGSNCSIREDVKIERGTEAGGGRTVLGDRVLLMSGVYIGHDCSIGDEVVVANNSSVAGHATLGRGCVIGGHSAILQHVRIGNNAMVAGMIAVRKDVIPYTVVSGAPPLLRSLNYKQLWPKLNFQERRLATALFKYYFCNNASLVNRFVGMRGRELIREEPELDARLNVRLDIEDLLKGSDAAYREEPISPLSGIFERIRSFILSGKSKRGVYLP